MSSSRSQAYTDAGVNINAGNELVSRIKSLVASTRIPGVVSDIGGFGGLFRPELEGMKTPVLVSSTDGVGTKLKLAALFDRHDTVGIDLVAMSVNDILVQGAKPLFFLDYFATGELNVEQAEAVVGGVAEGCRRGGCALLGGETAEMPGMYAGGDYDLAGFCVGIADLGDIVDGSGIIPGDVVLGLASSGVHSNGYTLVRKLFEASGASADDIFPGTNRSFREVLLEPTIIYTRILEKLLQNTRAKGMVHVTGGGFYDNIPRVLPQNVCARIDFGAWDMPPVFEWLKEQGRLSWPEMLQIFNCGIGYIVIVDGAEAENVLKRAHVLNSRAWKIGEITARKEQDKEQVDILFG
ncbi:MAG: phosphoribosylformylglycinamidine cyclo-ligase [Desulfovibrionaceae bacterium]|nr:MAG: phosphoribosylformylglycinamidine cyclo-ligase [Desulfovibrionaceae bacterium]